MKELISVSGNNVAVSCLNIALEEAGIKSICKGLQKVRETYDPLPIPSLWVEDADYERALNFIKERKNPISESWTCPDCGERVPLTFEICWKCGMDK